MIPLQQDVLQEGDGHLLDLPGEQQVLEVGGKLEHGHSGLQFNRKYFGLSFGMKNGLRSHFDSVTCLQGDSSALRLGLD